MRRFRSTGFRFFTASCFLILCAVCFGQGPASQSSSSGQGKSTGSEETKSQHISATELEHVFFAAVRAGDAKQVLAYVPEGGVNVGSKAEHLTRAEVEDQLTQHTGLYCKLFESSCIQSEIRLDNSSVRACSYRELLTKSSKVRTAASETTRNGVRQAILVAEVKNDNCSGVGLIDFIFNLQADGWKLFSIP